MKRFKLVIGCDDFGPSLMVVRDMPDMRQFRRVKDGDMFDVVKVKKVDGRVELVLQFIRVE